MSRRVAEREAFLTRAGAGRCVPVARVLPSDCLTPVMLFQRMRAPGAESFLLESVEGGEAVARYTFLGSGPSARLTVRGGETLLERGGHREVCEGAPLAILDRLVRRSEFVPDPDLPPLSRGAVGYLAYDAVRLFEAIPNRHPREDAVPEALFLLFDGVIAFDHPRQRLLLLTTVDRDQEPDPERAVEAAIARLDGLESFLSADPTSRPKAAEAETRFTPVMSKSAFLDAVKTAKEAIAAGDIYQAVISQRWTAQLGLDPFDVYRALRVLNPSPYLFYLETREATLLGSSPEMLVRCRGREVETRPIAGTVPRGQTPGEDAALAEQLLADPKERAEHVMLVDLARNDLGRVCEIGSVQVARYAGVEKFSHV
ncbi:MAG: chorismate-binding protein, partial [Acidobacteriota bacterium]